MDELEVKLSARTHPGAAGKDSFLRGGEPSPTRPSSLGGASNDSSPITRKSWLDRGSAYGGQRPLDLLTLAGAEDILDGGGPRPVVASSQPPPLRLPRWAGLFAVGTPPWVPMWVGGGEQNFARGSPLWVGGGVPCHSDAVFSPPSVQDIPRSRQC